MKTYKVELTKQQNNLVALRCKDEALALSAKFGGRCKDYTFWVTERELLAITETIGITPNILRESA